MRLSRESSSVRGWVMAVVITLAAWITAWHAHEIRRYLEVAGGLGLRGQPPATPLVQVYPAFAADALTWVRHAIGLAEGDALRLRHTTIDNAPEGREVHWNSAWAWTIAGAGKVEQWLNGGNFPRAVERGALWIVGVVLILLATVFGLLTARRAGALAGMVVVVAVVGHGRIYEGFFPTYVDHHGLLTMAVVGLVLGATFMGAGWWRPWRSDSVVELLPSTPEMARRGAVFSAVSGSLGLWVSAASVLPPIAIVGFAGLVSTLIMAPRMAQDGARFEPGVWRTWGRTGAVGSLAFYLIEYFPFQIGLRMEANHPFYGLAWLGAGEVIAQIAERWQRPAAERWRDAIRLIPALVAVSIAPAAILIGGPAVFVVRDPFLAELHRLYIAEFLPLWTSLKGKGWSSFFTIVGTENLPLFVGLGVLAVQRRHAPFLVWFGTIAAAAFTSVAWMQSRWLLNASGSQVALTLVLLAYFTRDLRSVWRWTTAGVVAAALFAYPALTRVNGARSDVAAKRVSPGDAQGALARDIAQAIRASQPEGRIVLLTNPNNSTNIGYYGRFQTLGTLYWENVEGLKSAAEVLSAKSLPEAAVLLRKYAVTHIAMISEENFIAQYHKLLYPNATDADIRQSFGHRLLVEKSIPSWLQVIPYQVPDDLKALNTSVMLFRVNFQQSVADALYHLALSKIASGALADAERDLNLLIERTPESYQPWLRKGEILFRRQDWSGALAHLLQGIGRAPEVLRTALYISTGAGFYRERRHAEAVQVYRVALAERFDPTIASYLAFVLSTSSQDGVRDGATALTLAETSLKQDPESSVALSSYATALAEVGRFEEAVAVAERVIGLAQQRQEASLRQLTERRLAAFRDRKPWRE